MNISLEDNDYERLMAGGCVAGSLRIVEGSRQLARFRVYQRGGGERGTRSMKTEHGKATIGRLRRSMHFTMPASAPVSEVVMALNAESGEAMRFFESQDGMEA